MSNDPLNPPADTQPGKTLSVAPMMAWTDRHCRYLHRLYSPWALLFTEMVTTGALLHGQRWHLLDYSPAEHPIVLQLGGNNPMDLARCTAEAELRGYEEVNLNVGCPSDRVKNGSFGACLMKQPDLVADCIKQMIEHCNIPVSVKCRLGVDDADSDALLHEFVASVADTGCTRFYLHARKAILKGLSPAQNRSVPPLQPERVALLKERFPHLTIVVNGGITDTATGLGHLEWADDIMIGRAAYQQPSLLTDLTRAMFDPNWRIRETEIIAAYRAYMEEELAKGTRLHSMTRHLLNCFAGVPGARRFRRILSDHKRLGTQDINILDDALDTLQLRAA